MTLREQDNKFGIQFANIESTRVKLRGFSRYDFNVASLFSKSKNVQPCSLWGNFQKKDIKQNSKYLKQAVRISRLVYKLQFCAAKKIHFPKFTRPNKTDKRFSHLHSQLILHRFQIVF